MQALSSNHEPPPRQWALNEVAEPYSRIRGWAGNPRSAKPSTQDARPGRSDEQRFHLAARRQVVHRLVRRTLLETLRRVQQPRQDLDVAAGQQERLGAAEHP